jgi:DNA uptake protein ComE-like DNA-binding protein
MRNPPHHHRRGTVLVIAMWICIALAAVALVLAREMQVESFATLQHLSQAKADAAERGIEQASLNWVTNELLTPGYIDDMSFEQRTLGDCYYWILKANPDDEQTVAYGLTREAGRLDINTATYEQLMLLPNMTDELASCIVDWYDADDDPTGTDGAEDAYYMSQDPPFHCKNAPFESLDELRLVKGIGDQIDINTMLWGADTNHNGIIEPAELDNANQGANFQVSARGLMHLLTVYGVKGTTPFASTDPTTGAALAPTVIDPATGNSVTVADVNANSTTNLSNVLNTYLSGQAAQLLQQTRSGAPFQNIWDWAVRCNLTSQDFSQIYLFVTCTPRQTVRGGGGGAAPATTTTPAKVDIMEASLPVLEAIGFEESEADAIITYRTTNVTDPSQKANIAWLLDIVSHDKFRTVGTYITGTSTVYSADIVTVSRDGRAFKRVKIVIDASSGIPQIIHREDLTRYGWPLDPAIREDLKAGKDISGLSGNTSFSSAMH